MTEPLYDFVFLTLPWWLWLIVGLLSLYAPFLLSVADDRRDRTQTKGFGLISRMAWPSGHRTITNLGEKNHD